jgi:hypothetical protein
MVGRNVAIDDISKPQAEPPEDEAISDPDAEDARPSGSTARIIATTFAVIVHLLPSRSAGDAAGALALRIVSGLT